VISVDIAPLPTCPTPAGIRFVTNVYHITATAPLGEAANLVIRYSNLLADPSDVYFRHGSFRSVEVDRPVHRRLSRSPSDTTHA